MGKKASNKQNGKKPATSDKRTHKQGGSFPSTTVGIVVFIIVIVAVVYSWNSAPSISADVPSGNVCQENIDYLQAGVDSYREAFGAFPTTLEQLMESRDGKGPFVETIGLRCPSSRKPYIIANGVVRDSN
ncbi:MAG: hypothetical protein KGZ63_08700 [Clostridiales bacterium]|jgi:hypothetical protein|nr:hypothetical protein [Clostridiales bacterium]